MGLLRAGMAAALMVGISACASESEPVEDAPVDPAADPVPEENTEEGETVSILRPDVEAEQEPLEEPPLEQLDVTIGFPNGGDEIDGAALAALQEVLASEQMALGGPILLGAHSDSAGSDTANADAAEARGLAVAAWLIEKGVDEDRIQVIVFGEQNPIEPNALPDGDPNEAGRALNRRVEVSVIPPFDETPLPVPPAQSDD